MLYCSTCDREWEDSLGRCPDDNTTLSSSLDGTMIDAEDSTLRGALDAITAPTDQVAIGSFRPDLLLEGTAVSEYEIERVIGTGGMGTVYGARHPLIGKRAAIKVLHAKCCADQNAVDRFVQEAQAVNRIGHANIVDIFAFGALEDGRSYLVMEWLAGETLREHLKRKRRLTLNEAITILVPLTRALEAAHAAGVIHRDLKPENVILVPDDEGFRVKLLDFGIAKLSTSEPSPRRTATGAPVGTPVCMSPEQAKGLEMVDARTDHYALGVMAYTLVCGESPFEHEGSTIEILHAHINKPAPSPRALIPDLPEAMERLILELLAKDPDVRPGLTETRHRLKALVDNPFVDRLRSQPSIRHLRDAPATTMRIVRSAPDLRLVAGIAGVLVAAVVIMFVAGRETDARRSDTTMSAAGSVEREQPADKRVDEPIASPTVERTDEPASSRVERQQLAAVAKLPRTGTIVLVVAPKQATVAVDGTPVQLVRGRAEVELAPGDHDITVGAAGYLRVAKRVPVVAAKVTPLTLQLIRPRAAKRIEVDGVIDPFSRKPK